MKSVPLKIVADENIPALQTLFAPLGKLHTYPGRAICRDDLLDADILLVRSVTPVNRALLQGISVRFVGTATIGTDHIDQAALAELGIAFSSAPGCNADAVVEYVLSVLLHLADEQRFDLWQRCVGIVGVGNVGSRLAGRLQALGIRTLLCDPPRQRLLTASEASQFCSLERLLREADIVSLHTPLTHSGEDATWHLLQAETLAMLQPNTILINAGRGPVIDNEALYALALQRDDLTFVLDVWENEPVVDAALAECVKIATPHIAGYSLEGKLRGTWMLYQAWCEFVGHHHSLSFEQLLPAAEVSEISLTERAGLLPPVRLLYDPYRDDRALRASLHLAKQQQAATFDQLRKQYPVRREFSALTLRLPVDRQPIFSALGFPVADVKK